MRDRGQRAARAHLRARLAPLLACVAACSAPATPAELVRAERFEHDGDDAGALAAFQDAVPILCAHAPPRWCAAALTGAASALERLGRLDQAARAYESIPPQLPALPEQGAAAWVDAAEIRLKLHEDARAYDLYWTVIQTYPESAAADEALRHIFDDGRRRNPRQLYGVLDQLFARLQGSELGDNLLWDMARIADEDLHDEPTALVDLDRLVKEYPKSPLVDDALWHGGQIARAHRDFEGALRRWQQLLAMREEAMIIGSYHSVHMPRTQFEVGLLLRDDLGRLPEALVELRRLEKNYPHSTLRDDALYEIAVTQDRLGDAAGACRTLASLKERFPESRYEIEQAPTLRARVCR